MATRPRRSCLTVPASSAKMLAKAAGLPADEVVVDLEDGVAPADKDAARSRLGEAAARGTLAVRINAVGTAWWRDDLAAVAARRPDVVVLPKAASAEDVRQVIELLPDGVGLEVQIESAHGLIEVERIAALGSPLEALVFGPGDFAASMAIPELTIGSGTFDYALARANGYPAGDDRTSARRRRSPRRGPGAVRRAVAGAALLRAAPSLPPAVRLLPHGRSARAARDRRASRRRCGIGACHRRRPF